ncbi:hypothetical protein TNCV_3703781 [Trichonephila clavipes]|nr:hypothetical protein TNCV_3703781 [Trichonephila clavipes]
MVWTISLEESFDKMEAFYKAQRSSTLQLDSEFRKELNLDHSSLEFLQGAPSFQKNPPQRILVFELNCCSHVPKRKTRNSQTKRTGNDSNTLQDNFCNRLH